jgi:hypothetical protein
VVLAGVWVGVLDPLKRSPEALRACVQREGDDRRRVQFEQLSYDVVSDADASQVDPDEPDCASRRGGRTHLVVLTTRAATSEGR